MNACWQATSNEFESPWGRRYKRSSTRKDIRSSKPRNCWSSCSPLIVGIVSSLPVCIAVSNAATVVPALLLHLTQYLPRDQLGQRLKKRREAWIDVWWDVSLFGQCGLTSYFA